VTIHGGGGTRDNTGGEADVLVIGVQWVHAMAGKAWREEGGALQRYFK
jgi:hypothetical protein